MPQELFTAEDVAARLGLHVRTVRGYIREGRLRAVRIGKQYRITRADLDAFTGGSVAATDPEPARTHRHAEASSVVDVDAVSPELASRVSTLLTAAAAGRGPGEQRLRLETIYDEERAHLKVVAIGGLADAAEVFGLIRALVEEGTP